MSKQGPADYSLREGAKEARLAGDDWRHTEELWVQQVTIERDVEAAPLKRERERLQSEEARCTVRLGYPDADSKAASIARLLGGLTWLSTGIFCGWAGYELVLQTLRILFGKFESGAVVLALVLAAGTAIASEECLRKLARVVPKHIFRMVLLCVALAAVVCLLSASLVLSFARAEYVSAQQAQAQQENQVVAIEGAMQENSSPVFQQAVDDFYRKSRTLTTLLMFLASAGLELIAALALHEAQARVLPSLVVLVEQRRLTQLRDRIEHLTRAIEWWQRYPDLVRTAFRRGAILESGRQVQRKAVILLVCLAVFLAVFLLFTSRARAQETVVVALDLSTSSAGHELKENVRAVERIIAKIPPGSQLLLIPIGKKSFAGRVILNARISAETGLFDERVKAARRELTRVWRQRSSSLNSGAKETDIFGALLKVAVLRDESAVPQMTLVLLSDMRQAARGYNFEGQTPIEPPLLERVAREGLIPPLERVDVWVLGAHAVGIPDMYWLRLRTFWGEYFKRSGATLKAFSPERRWNRDQTLTPKDPITAR